VGRNASKISFSRLLRIANTEKSVNVLKKAYGLTDAQICLCLDNDEAGSAFVGRNPQRKNLSVKDNYLLTYLSEILL
jgi:hypothetical protein